MASTGRLSNSSETPTVLPPVEPSKPEKNDEKAISSDDPFLISDLGDDPSNPMNWPSWRKWYITMMGGLLVLNATFASSAPSGIIEAWIEEYDLSMTVATLTISLFVLGYCVGPLLWGPLSEEYGRKPIFIVSFFVYTMFQIAMGLARNVASLLVFRFIGGVFAACPLANSGALISDIWDIKTRGTALAIFTIAPFGGPALGPSASGFIYVSGTSWRWLFWVLSIFAGVCLVLVVFTVPETYKPILLKRLAAKRRKETGDDRYYAASERISKTLRQQVENVLARPFKLLFLEPMMWLTTIYTSFIYGCLYLLFEAYPIVFTQGHGFNAGISGLMFLPIMLGGVVAVTIYVFTFSRRYQREADRLAPNPVPPEFRLEMGLIAAPLFAISFFWFGWTSYPSVSFWSPMMSGGLLAFGISWIFLSLFNYIIDTYTAMAASALSANTVVRSIFGAAFPLFATQMFDAMGARWASSLLGFVALAMTPIPFVFMKYGAQLRAKSRFSDTAGSPRKESENSAA